MRRATAWAGKGIGLLYIETTLGEFSGSSLIIRYKRLLQIPSLHLFRL